MLHSNLSQYVQDKYSLFKTLLLVVIITIFFQTAKDIVRKVFQCRKVDTDDDEERRKFLTELLVEFKVLQQPRKEKLGIKIITITEGFWTIDSA